jgi:hypothetical protein
MQPRFVAGITSHLQQGALPVVDEVKCVLLLRVEAPELLIPEEVTSVYSNPPVLSALSTENDDDDLFEQTIMNNSTGKPSELNKNMGTGRSSSSSSSAAINELSSQCKEETLLPLIDEGLFDAIMKVPTVTGKECIPEQVKKDLKEVISQSIYSSDVRESAVYSIDTSVIPGPGITGKKRDLLADGLTERAAVPVDQPKKLKSIKSKKAKKGEAKDDIDDIFGF